MTISLMLAEWPSASLAGSCGDAGTVNGREYDGVAGEVLNQLCPIPERE
jgi:hypothetical protein